jgi:hypothetical protein
VLAPLSAHWRTCDGVGGMPVSAGRQVWTCRRAQTTSVATLRLKEQLAGPPTGGRFGGQGEDGRPQRRASAIRRRAGRREPESAWTIIDWHRAPGHLSRATSVHAVLVGSTNPDSSAASYSPDCGYRLNSAERIGGQPGRPRARRQASRTHAPHAQEPSARSLRVRARGWP